jgi:type I restriction enzyme S subunit
LGELVGFASGYAFPVVRQGGGGGSIPFFKVSDMNAAGNGVVLRSAANYVDEATLQAMRAKTWAEGTVVFPKVGAALLTEKRRLLGQRSAFDNNVMGLVPNREVTPRFLYWFMTTVRLGEYAQHGAVPSVNQGHLASIAIPVPSLSEQEEFCATADALQGLAAACSTTATAMSTVRSALLADLLAGEHEIPESYDRLLDAVA